MEVKESFTVEEIQEVFGLLEIETHLVKEVQEDGREIWSLECESDGIQFTCTLLRQQPFFEHVVLYADGFTQADPLQLASNFNADHGFSVVQVDLDESGSPEIDEDGDYPIRLDQWISFIGGVTSGHLRFLINMWMSDLLDFFGFEDDEDSEVPEFQPLEDAVLEMDIAEQIAWALGDGIPRSARELAEHLMMGKTTVNSALYKHIGKFVKDSGQPPRWSLAN